MGWIRKRAFWRPKSGPSFESSFESAFRRTSLPCDRISGLFHHPSVAEALGPSRSTRPGRRRRFLRPASDTQNGKDRMPALLHQGCGIAHSRAERLETSSNDGWRRRRYPACRGGFGSARTGSRAASGRFSRLGRHERAPRGLPEGRSRVEAIRYLAVTSDHFR